MRIHGTFTLAAGAVALGVAGCSEGPAPGSSGTSVSISVAPLDLPGMTDVCYGLTVWNDADPDVGTEVWSQPNLCASDYGAANGIRFTGICDVNAVGGKNSIRLVLNDIYKGGAFDGGGTALASDATTPSGIDYINPCPPATGLSEDNGCILDATCVTNQDTKVEFNLTVMRQASLGFFDTVVKFQDVFCAAKLDCVEDDGNDGTKTLNYLYNPNANPPGDGPTAVLGFTCLGGSGDEISMYLDDLVVTCTGASPGTATVDPSGGPGNLSGSALVQTGLAPLFGAAVNTGAGFQGAQYWNVLLGMNLSPANGTCTLHTTGTVSEVALTGGATPAHTRYPIIDWTVTLSDASGRVCTRHPLNAENGVGTVYTDIDTPALFAHRLTVVEPEPAHGNYLPAYKTICGTDADCAQGEARLTIGLFGARQCTAVTPCPTGNECDSGEFCNDQSYVRHCAEAGSFGQWCDRNLSGLSMCPAGSFCDSPGVCRELGGLGAVCDMGTCKPGLTCNGQDWPPTCVAAGATPVGGNCSTYNDTCAPGSQCGNFGTCVALGAALGQDCGFVGQSWPRTDSCASGLYCDSQSRHCVAALADASECSIDGSDPCGDASWCDESQSPALCAPKGSAGAPCGYSNDACTAGFYCDVALSTHACRAIDTEATYCHSDDWCASGMVCNTNLDMCVPASLSGCTTNNGGCGGDAAVCVWDWYSQTQQCLQCTTNAHCAGNPNGNVCNPATSLCVGCLGNADCEGNATGALCDTTVRECVECLSNADCGVSSCATDTFCVCGAESACQGHVPAVAISSASSARGTCSLTSLADGGVVKCEADGWGVSPVLPLPATQISTGGDFANNNSLLLWGCARLTDGTVRCWDQTPTVWDPGFVGVTQVSIGGGMTAGNFQFNACAVLLDGRVQCTGANGSGQLGKGVTDVNANDPPADVTGITTAVAVEMGDRHACALLADGTVKCWGANGQRQLGNGTTTSSNVPVAVSGLTGVTSIRAGGAGGWAPGYAATCAIVTGGSVKCWGTEGTWNSSIPVEISGFTAAVTAIDVGGTHFCALLVGGAVQCWGYNTNNKVGFGNTGTQDGVTFTTAQSVVGLPGNAIGVSASFGNSCALLDTGVVWCWGYPAGYPMNRL